MPYLVMLLNLHILMAAAAAVPPKECPDYPANLEACKPFSCTFTHPFTGGKMERKIIELKKNGVCMYAEQMPNGGKMECSYTDSTRKAVAKYLRDALGAKSAETTVHMTGKRTTTKYTIDGKEVDNPLQTALDSGQCKISGYGPPPKK